MNNDQGDQQNTPQDDQNNLAQAAGSEQAEQNIQATQSAWGSLGEPSSNVDLPMPSQSGGTEQTSVGSPTLDSGVYNSGAADVAMGSQTKPADRGQTEGAPGGEGGTQVPPVQPTGGSVQTPVGSSTPDMGVYNTEAADVAMGSQTKPADRGQTEGGAGTSS